MGIKSSEMNRSRKTGAEILMQTIKTLKSQYSDEPSRQIINSFYSLCRDAVIAP